MQTLLIVDEDPSLRASLRRIGEDIGYVVKAVPNGPLARDVCEGDSVDVALVDAIMPGEDGITAMLRLHRLRPRVPVIVMSDGGRAANADILTIAESAGADAVLRKPFSGRDLVAAIDRAHTKALSRNALR